MASQAAQPQPPIAALAVAGYGAILGSLFPVVTVMTIADVSGGLSVAADSGALVNTMQNVGSIAGILITPTLFFGIGRGRTLTVMGLGFLISSIACAVAPSLGWMLVARTFHGLFGGTLPLLFMMLAMTTLRPGAGQLEGITLFAGSTSLFFGCAALIGAFLVDHMGWRALFWAQAIAALPYCLAASRVLTSDKGNPDILRRIDWSNYLSLTIGLALILFSVSEGERHFWLDAWWVPALFLGGSILTGSAVHSMIRSSPHPLLVLSVFQRPTFFWGITLSLFFRFGLLFAVYIVPAFLGRMQGLRPSEIGQILVLMSPATLLALGGAWFLAQKLDARLLLSAGLAHFAVASWLCIGLDSSWAADQLRLAAIIAGFGMGIFGVAVLRFATFGAGMVDGPTVGVVFNLARVFGNVGSLAILIHLVTEREKFHSAVLVERLSSVDPSTAQRLAGSASGLGQFNADGVNAQAGALSSLARATSNQAFTLAFADALTVISITLAIGAVLVWALPHLPNATTFPSRPRNAT